MPASISSKALLCIISSVFTILFSTVALLAQDEARRSVALEKAVERLLERSDEEDASLLFDQLEQYVANPLCLRTAALDELEALPLLSPALAFTIHSLMRSDSASGWSVLRRLPDMDSDTYTLLRTCAIIDCGKKQPLPDVLHYRGRVQQEDRPRAGFLDGRYPGSRARIQQRISLQSFGFMRAGILQEKDPGETDFTDHITGYVSFETQGIVKKMVLGDFTVASGNGLVFWQSFGLSKGSDALSAGRRSSQLLAPYASATEGLFYRGGAIQLHVGDVSLLAFLSRNTLDATIDQENGTAGAFGIDGLHRSTNERKRRHSVQENLYGMRTQWESLSQKSALRAGTSAWLAHYSIPSDPKTPFGFRGDYAWVAGGDLSYTIGRVHLFGEAALCHLDRSALLFGLRAPLHAKADVLLLWRRYDARFVNIHGFGFGERGGELQNEKGLYLGFRLRPVTGLRIDAWVDIFAFPNRTWLLHLPTSGGETMVTANWQISKMFACTVRSAHGEKSNTVATKNEYGHEIRPLARRQSSSLRAEFVAEFPSAVRLRLRADRVWVRYDAWKDDDDGFLFLADCRVTIVSGLMLTGRMALVESGSYDARVYQFEHDVPGVMQNVAVYGRGVRSYIVADWQPVPQLRFGLKYGITIRDAASSIGDGADAVAGDALGKGTFQIELRL